MSNEEALPLLSHILQTLLWFAGRLITNAHWLLLAPHTKPVWEKVIGGLVTLGLLILIWQRRPVASWAFWTGLFLIPFLFIPEHILQGMPIGPSRYLYFASAGTSVLLAWAAQHFGRWLVRSQPKFGRLLYCVLLGILLGYNCWTLRKTEAQDQCFLRFQKISTQKTPKIVRFCSTKNTQKKSAASRPKKPKK